MCSRVPSGLWGNGRMETEVPWVWSEAGCPRRASCGVHLFRGVWDPGPSCLHNCADATGFGLVAGGRRWGRGMPVVVCCMARMAGMGQGQWWVAVRVGPIGQVPPMGAVVVLVCMLDVLGGVGHI